METRKLPVLRYLRRKHREGALGDVARETLTHALRGHPQSTYGTSPSEKDLKRSRAAASPQTRRGPLRAPRGWDSLTQNPTRAAWRAVGRDSPSEASLSWRPRGAVLVLFLCHVPRCLYLMAGSFSSCLVPRCLQQQPRRHLLNVWLWWPGWGAHVPGSHETVMVRQVWAGSHPQALHREQPFGEGVLLSCPGPSG